MPQAHRKQVAADTITLATNTIALADIIPYDAAVAEGRIAAEQIADAQGRKLRLGELAHKLEPKYDARTLATFAEDIGVAADRLGRYRDIWRAWDGAGICAPGRVSFAVLKELATVEDRAELLKAHPDMTKRQAEVHRVLKDHPKRKEIISRHPNLSCATQARKAVREYDTGVEEQANEWPRDNKRWQAEAAVVANKLIELAEVRKRCSSEQRRDLGTVLEPSLVETMRKAIIEEGAELVEWLDELLDEGADTKIQEGRVKTGPAQAQEPVHPAT